MTITAADARKIMEIAKVNEAKLAACDSHLFELVKPDKPTVRLEYQCAHCGGTITGMELHWYMVGRAHGMAQGERMPKG